MQIKRSVLGAACALLAIAAAAHADDKAVTLETHLKAGDSVRQKVTVNASVNGTDVVVVQIGKETLKEIDKKGNLVWVQTTESAKVNLGGTEQEQGPTPPITVVRDKMNKLVEFTPAEAAEQFMSPEVQKMTAMASEIILPDKPVKADDSWTTEFDNPIVKDKKVVVKTTFVGADKVDGKEYWKLKQTAVADTDKDGAKTSSETTAWLDPADGSMVKMEGTVKDLPTQVGNLSWTMKREKIKVEKSDKPA